MILPETLLQLAQAASISGAKITIKNPGFMLPQTMINIAQAGRGNVVFEI